MPEPAASGALLGLVVLVTRPAAQAGTLCRLIEAEGGTALRLPLIDIAPVADEASAAHRLQAARAAARWIFSSVNAVVQAARMAPPPWPPAAAVGATTAAALRELGCVDLLAPEAGEGAAALLARAEFQSVAGRGLAVICGEQPLPLLEAELVARGAAVEVIPVYRRVPAPLAPEQVIDAITRADAIVVASGEALHLLMTITPSSVGGRLLARQLVLPSPRVVETARELGFERTPLLTRQVSDAGFVAALRDLARTRAKDRPTDSP